jgi:tRNA(Ile)-lysidine synthase
MAHDAGARAILQAHHRRDQAETVLLQALRGAGAAGLAAMPRALEREGVWWLRPWLDLPREAIEAYVRRHRLRHVDDASNADPRFARSRLRSALWPALTKAFPDAEGALAALARRAHEANGLLAEVAAQDLASLADGPQLDVTRWRTLSAPRRANALRAWLQRVLDSGTPETLIERLLPDLMHAAHARWPVDAQRQLLLYRGRLQLIAPVARAVPAPATDTIDLSRPGRHALPHWGGTLEVARVARGVPASALKACALRAREGGEQFQSAPRGTPRSLKKQYQAAGIPAWQRAGPLVFADGALLFVPGLGLDARRLGAGSGLTLRWHPDPPGGAGPVLQRS